MAKRSGTYKKGARSGQNNGIWKLKQEVISLRQEVESLKKAKSDLEKERAELIVQTEAWKRHAKTCVQKLLDVPLF